MADDISAAKQAKHAEIKRHYGRKWRAELKPERIRSVRRAQVLLLLADRGGDALPDDLQLLFELGLDGPTAQQLAPWADGDDIDQLIEGADANGAAWCKPVKATDPTIAEMIGQRLKVTFEEFKRLRLSHVRPADVSRDEANRYIRALKTKRDSNRDRKLAKSAVASARAMALFLGPLADRKSWTGRALTNFVQQQRLSEFEGLAAPRTAVLRAVKELQRFDMVETKIEDGPRGLKVLSVVRPWTEAEIEDAHRLDDVEEAT